MLWKVVTTQNGRSFKKISGSKNVKLILLMHGIFDHVAEHLRSTPCYVCCYVPPPQNQNVFFLDASRCEPGKEVEYELYRFSLSEWTVQEASALCFWMAKKKHPKLQTFGPEIVGTDPIEN